MHERNGSNPIDQLRGWSVNQKNRIFPPSGNKEALINVLDGYDKLGIDVKEDIAPWMNIHSNESAVTIQQNLSANKQKFKESVADFNNTFGIKTSFQKGVENMENLLDKVWQQSTGRDYEELNASYWDVKIILLNRTFKSNDAARFYVNRIDKLPSHLQQLVHTGKKYLAWQTIRGRSGFKEFNNPWEDLITMYNLGMSEYSINAKTDDIDTKVLLDTNYLDKEFSYNHLVFERIISPYGFERDIKHYSE